MNCIRCGEAEATKPWHLTEVDFEEHGITGENTYRIKCFCLDCRDYTDSKLLDEYLFKYWEIQQQTKKSGPKYYTWHPKVNAVEVSQHFTSNLGQAIQYLWRSNILEQTKGQTTAEVIVDLEKAINFINFEIARLKEL